MQAIARFVGLDLRSMRPNVKLLIIPAAIVVGANLAASAMLLLNADDSGEVESAGLSVYLLIPAMSCLAVLNTPSHLFGNDERGRLDTLYAALGIRREHVVLGRYATCLLLLIAFTVAGTLVAPVAALAFGAEFEWAVAAAVAAASVTLIGILLATQLPAFFATGPGPIRIVAVFAPAIIMAVIFLAAGGFPTVRTAAAVVARRREPRPAHRRRDRRDRDPQHPRTRLHHALRAPVRPARSLALDRFHFQGLDTGIDVGRTCTARKVVAPGQSTIACRWDHRPVIASLLYRLTRQLLSVSRSTAAS